VRQLECLILSRSADVSCDEWHL